jgi:hypothetical protein
MLLQNLDQFDDLVLLDPDTEQISMLSRSAHPELSAQSVRGHFADLAGHRIYFYRAHDERLHVRVDELHVEFNRETRVTLVRQDIDTNRFQVLRNGSVVIDLLYPRPVLDPPLAHDPTPFVDEEDFDICLLIHNVMTDAARRERIYR